MGRLLLLILVSLTMAPAPAVGSESLDVGAEIARLRGRLAANSAQEQQCLAGASRPMWTASVASDLKALQARASEAAAQGADGLARRWQELAQKAAALEAQAAASARGGTDHLRGQQIGLDCLERFASEGQALRASLEVALANPDAYRESLLQARAHGSAGLRQDLARLEEHARGLSAEWKVTRVAARAGAQALKAEMDDLRRCNTVALESEPARAMADPTLRGAEALVAAAEAWERANAAAARLAGATEEGERRKTALERDEAARQAQEYWATAERLLGRPALRVLP
jgi:hypothetical protein